MSARREMFGHHFTPYRVGYCFVLKQGGAESILCIIFLVDQHTDMG